MKLAILVALCLSFAAARLQQNQDQDQDQLYQSLRQQKQIQDTAFRAGREYQYLYNGQVLTGIPGSSRQHAGTKIKAVVLIQVKSNSQVVLKLTDIRFGKINTDISNPRKTQPMSIFEEVQLEPEHRSLLQKPLVFAYTHGMIHDIHFEESEQPWSANIKRGVLNMLQVNLKEHHRVETEEHQLQNSLQQGSEMNEHQRRFYRVLEKSLEGECETVYEIGRRPARHADPAVPVLNVTKSIDFEKCQKRPQIKYNWRFSEYCPTCDQKYQEDEKFLKSSTVAKYNITGTTEQFLIESSEVESQYTFVPMQESDSVVNTYIKQKLELARTQHIAREIQAAATLRSDSDMVYTVDWDVAKEKFYMAGEDKYLHKSPFSQMPNKIHTVAELLRQLVTSIDEKIQEEAPHHFTRLITILRQATHAELEQVQQSFYESQHNSFTPEEQKKAKELLISAIALAGTSESVKVISQKIRERKISHLTGAFAIRQLQSARVVSEQMIHELKSLARDQVAQESHQLKQAIWLTYGSFANALCGETEDQWALEQKVRTEQLCRTTLKEEIVKTLFEELKKTENWEEQLTIMKAIANAGLDLSIFELEKVIYNRERHYPAFLRAEAISAMQNLRQQMPRKIRKVLIPVYLNERERPEVRITALYEIMNTQPSRPTLELIAKKLNDEPSRQVASFAYSYMSQLANSTNPCYENMTQDLQHALRFTKEIRPGVQYSKLVHLPFHIRSLGLGADINIANVMSNMSLIPFQTAISLDTNTLGMWHRYLATVGFGAEGLEPLLFQLVGENGLFSENAFEDFVFKHHPKNTGRQYQQELKELFRTLKIKSRDYTREPKAWFYLKLKGQEVGFLPISKNMIAQYLNLQSGLNVREIEQKLRQGVQINTNKATMLREISFKIPTTIGLPLVWKHKVPAVLSLKGKIQLQVQDGFKQLVLSGDFKPSIAVSSQHSMEIWCPIVNSGLKVLAEARVFAPLKGKVEVNMQQTPKQVKIFIEPPKTPKELLHVETKPVTFTFAWPKSINTWQEAEEKTVRGEEWNRVQTIDESYGRRVAGMELKIRGRIHKVPAKRVSGTPICPLSGPNKFVVELRPGQNQPEEIEIKLEGLLNQPAQSNNQFEKLTTYDQFPGDSSSSESVSASASAENQQNQHQQQSRERQHAQKIQRQHSRQSSKSSDSSEESFETQPQGEARQNQLTVEVTARGPVKRHLTIVATHKFTPGFRYNKLNAHMQVSPSAQLNVEQFAACLNAEVAYPKKPNTLSEVSTKKVVAQAELKWGQSCSSNNFVLLKVQAERSQAQKHWEEQQQQRENDECRSYERKGLQSPVACYEKLAERAMLKKYTVDVEYSHLPVVVKNITDKIVRYLKYRYYWQSDVATMNVQNPQNKVQAKIYLDPESNQRINVTLKTPQQNITMQNIPLPCKVTPLNTKRSVLSQFLYQATNEKYQTRALCQVTDRRVRTFDGARYSAPISTCYSVLAKDCTEESRFAVMIKKISETSQHKKMKILTPRHKIVLSMENQQIKVEVNDQQITQEHKRIEEHGHEVAVIEREGQYVQVELPETGLQVEFDGYTANVKVSPLYMYRQCGLCGNYDSEPAFDNEFMTPEFQPARNMHSFYLAYTTKEAQCNMPANIEQHNWRYDSNESSEESSESQSSSESSSKSKSGSKSHSSSQSDSKSTSQSNSKSNSDSKSKSDSQSQSQESMESFQQRRQHKSPVRRTKTIERLGKTCYSTQQVAQCPRKTVAAKYEAVTQLVKYHCINNNDSRVSSQLDSSESVETPDLANAQTTFEKHERIPKACEQY